MLGLTTYTTEYRKWREQNFKTVISKDSKGRTDLKPIYEVTVNTTCTLKTLPLVKREVLFLESKIVWGRLEAGMI